MALASVLDWAVIAVRGLQFRRENVSGARDPRMLHDIVKNHKAIALQCFYGGV